jgi:hypothetical protein
MHVESKTAEHSPLKVSLVSAVAPAVAISRPSTVGWDQKVVIAECRHPDGNFHALKKFKKVY